MTRYKFAYVDPSIATVVVACKACPHWSAVRLDRPSAYRAKADHDQRVHGVEPARANHAGNQFDERSGVSRPME